MKSALTSFAYLLLCVQLHANPSSVVSLHGMTGNGSAVIIRGGYVLTIEHLMAARPRRIMFDGKNYPTEIIHNPVRNMTDEAGLLRIADISLPYSVISTREPEVGDAVSSVGYPFGERAALTGTITKIHNSFRGSTVSGSSAAWAIETDMLIHSGWSGGALFNESGNLIGLASRTRVHNGKRILPSSYAGLQSIRDAVARIPASRPRNIKPEKPDLIVFSLAGCAPCNALKDEVRGGAYSRWNVIFCEYDGVADWKTPWIYVDGLKELQTGINARDLHSEFRDKTKAGPDLSAPTLWVRYTSHYHTGNRGVLAWLRGIFAGVRDMFFGERAPVPPSLPPGAMPEPVPGDDVSAISKLRAEIKAALDDIAKLKRDGKALKDSGIIGKVGKLRTVKADVAQLEGRLNAIKGHWGELRSGLEDPRALLNLAWVGLGWFYRRRRSA